MAADSQLADRVRDFVARQTLCPLPKISLDTSLADDLGLFGDDADEFFIAFTKAFQVDPKSLDWRNLVEHFGCEGEGSLATLVVSLVVLIPVLVLGTLLQLSEWAMLVGFFVLQAAFLAACARLWGRHHTRRPDAILVRDLVEAAAAGRWVKGEAARRE